VHFSGNRSFSFQPNKPVNFQQFYQIQVNQTCNYSLLFYPRLFYSVGNNFKQVVVLTGQAASRDSSKVGAITNKGTRRKKPRGCFGR
jgi:hypothetical protein